MRIQNNIMALNTHRSYTINNDNVAASAEKLSSGYRINRAGDDAAGLAISEKMRSQVRGLTMAARNSQDAVSLVQTAEGALQEVHSMLQRMNELAVQSATGSNESFDRTQISKEFEQLKKEINDISEQTTFNNMKLLDGSLSNEGIKRSAYSVGISTSFQDVSAAAKNVKLQATVKGVDDQLGSVTFSDTAIAGMVEDGTTFSITIDGVEFNGTVTTGTAGAKATVAELKDALEVNAAFSATIALGGLYDIDITSGSLQITQKAAANQAMTATFNYGTVAVDPASGTTVKGVAETKGSSTYDIDVSKLQIGDQFSMNGQKFQLIATAGDAVPGGVTGIVWDTTDTAANLQAALVTAFDGAFADATVTNSGSTFTIEMDAAGVTATSTKINYIPAPTTDFTFEMSRLKEGDEITFSDGTNTYTHTYIAGQTTADIAKAMNTQGFSATANGNQITVKGNGSVEFSPVYEGGQSMRIQVGALENEQLNIEIKAMNSTGLNLDDSIIDTQDSAGLAITATRDAINQVSDQRALLGAMQNRMTHKIANIKVSAENLTAAESRIRDVDIASEMTNFTKNNILSQAATAMLAQANAAPQNVLSLLR